MIGRERERGRKFSAKRGRERKKELSKAEKRDAEYSICLQVASVTIFQIKKDFIKIKLPL